MKHIVFLRRGNTALAYADPKRIGFTEDAIFVDYRTPWDNTPEQED